MFSRLGAVRCRLELDRETSDRFRSVLLIERERRRTDFGGTIVVYGN